jgi:hypothetical protein
MCKISFTSVNVEIKGEFEKQEKKNPRMLK